MKIYGVGLFHAPGSSRVIWDFVDGPFDTVNPVLIAEAKKRGYSFTLPQESPKVAEPQEIKSEIIPPKKKAGRPAKVNHEPIKDSGDTRAVK